jgi:glutamine amidotransferase
MQSGPPIASSFPGRARSPTACASSGERRARRGAGDRAYQPFLGICIGMQMLFERGEEGDVAGLGVLAGNVPRFPAGRMAGLKVPHMGWNEVVQQRQHPLVARHPERGALLFRAQLFPAPTRAVAHAASCTYGVVFTCAVARDNIFAVQFHPEKSQSAGLQLLSNFIDWRP